MTWQSFLVGTSNWFHKGMAIIRMMLGFLLIYHGMEVFNSSLMHEYATWENFKGPFGLLEVYVGKSAELIAGISLLLGAGTRFGAVIVILTFLYITFFLGNGRFWYEDQHPFMFALFGLVYLMYGPGMWSMDKWFFASKSNREQHPAKTF
jgi:putative oxidoreductase